MIIVNQWRDNITDFKNIQSMDIKKVSEFDITQTTRLNKNDINKFAIEITYLTVIEMETIRTMVTDIIGIYDKKTTAQSVLKEIAENYCSIDKKTYFMPDIMGCPFIEGE